MGIVHWQNPNMGATDEVRFKSIASGARENTGLFEFFSQISIFWTTSDDGLYSIAFFMQYDTADITKANYEKTRGYSIRLMRDITDIPAPTLGQYVIFTDGISTWRKGVRFEAFVLDKTLTPTGFTGTEGLDWINVKMFFNTNEEMKYPVQTIDLDGGVEEDITTTLTTKPYNVELLDSSGNVIESNVTISFRLVGGVYHIYIYSVDSLTDVELYILY
jgi:hypothetical protein